MSFGFTGGAAPLAVAAPVFGFGPHMQVLAGFGMPGFADRDGADAQFNGPFGVAVDVDGNVIVADRGNNRVRKIAPSGTVSTLAPVSTGFGFGGFGGTSLVNPEEVAVDGEGNVIFTCCDDHRVRKIAPSGTVSTLAGSGIAGSWDGAGASAQFKSPCGIAVDCQGNFIVADFGDNRVRKIAPGGTVSTLAGSGFAGFADGSCASAQFHGPRGVAVDCQDNVIVTDYNNNRVRKIAPDGTVSTLAGSGIRGFADGAGAAAQFNGPYGVAVDGEGNVIVADLNNKRLRKITPDGTVSTYFDGSCKLRGVAIDSDGCVVVATEQHTVAKIKGFGLSLVPPRAAQVQKPSTLTSDYAALLDDPTSADVTFVVNDERIPAHRIILAARSTYFRSMFSSGMREAQKGNDIVIQDTSPTAFRALLLYLYADKVTFDDTLVVDVLRKAKELELTRLHNHCERRCERGITAHNAVLWFMQADEYALEGLRENTFLYLTRNLNKIRAVAKDTLAKLTVEKPLLMAEVMMADVPFSWLNLK